MHHHDRILELGDYAIQNVNDGSDKTDQAPYLNQLFQPFEDGAGARLEGSVKAAIQNVVH